MPPIGNSFRSIMRGNSQSSGSGESSTFSDENDIQMQGWMRKQKETLRSWARRYFTLNGKTLTYYDSEDTSRGARGVLDFVDVTSLTTENNGLSLHLVNGKEVRLIADTHVAYSAWMAVLSAAVKKPRSKKSRTSKEGWAHCLTDDDVWTRFFVVIKHDSFSCYESEDDEAELALSGLIRAVQEWDGKRYGIVCSLNRGRTIKLCFDSAEEKMSWFLTLEFSVSYGAARMKKEASVKSNISDHNPVLRSESSKSEIASAATAEEDDGHHSAWGFGNSTQSFKALFWRLENTQQVQNSPIIQKHTQQGNATWFMLFDRLQQLDQLFQAWHEQLIAFFTWQATRERQDEPDAEEAFEHDKMRGKSMDEVSELLDGYSSCEGPGERLTLRSRSNKPRQRSKTLSDCHLEVNRHRKQVGPAVKSNSQIHAGDTTPAVPVVQPPAMQICIMIVGTRGDVQPFLAIAKRLQQDGHRVRLATHTIYRDFVMNHGVEFYPLGGDPKELAAYMVKTGGRLIPPLKLETLQKDVPRQMQIIEEILQSTWPAVSAPDPNGGGVGVPGAPFRAQAIISNPVTYGHIHVAEKLGVPLHVMFPQPWVPTVVFPHPMSKLPYSGKSQRRNFLSYKLVDLFMWEGTERLVNTFRGDVLGLQRIRKGGRGRDMLLDLDIPHSFMWSPALVPKPFDWSDLYDVTGTVNLKGSSTSYSPSLELEAFLGDDEGPIFVGFGSMVLENPRETTKMIIEAATRANVRVLIQSSWTDMAGNLDIPDNVFFIGNCPHEWLMPRVSAVVHHGGAGTTAGGLLAGKPTFIVPFFGDQPFWGRAVVKAGVGVEPCPITELTTEELRRAFINLQSPMLRIHCKFHEWNQRFKAALHKETSTRLILPAAPDVQNALEDVQTAGIAVHGPDGRIQMDVAEEEDIDLNALRRRSRDTIDEDEDLRMEKNQTIAGPPVLNICIMIVGTRGDVQPFLAIAQRLQQDGHRVRLATHAIYRDFVSSYGVEFYPLGGDPKELAAYMVKTGGHLIPTKIETIQKDVPRNLLMIEEILHSTWPAVSAPDPEGGGPGVRGKPFRAQAIISNPVTYGHIHVAERLGVPLHIMFPQPWVPTTAFPHPLSNMPYTGKAQKRNYLSYKLVDLLMWQGTEGIVNEFRTEVLELDAFLGDDDGPIFVGFGSMVIDNPRATTKMIIKASQQANVRVLIQSSWSDMAGDLVIPDNIFFVGNCPHDWLMPRVSAVVHHGGAGTTAAGLLAGKPTFIVPFFGDQPFWGWAVVKAGVGVEPCPIEELTTEKLRRAFKRLKSAELRSRALVLQKKMQQEDGAEEAVCSFYRHLPLQDMRCDLDHVRVATKWSRSDKLKLCDVCDFVIGSRPENVKKKMVDYHFVDYTARGPTSGFAGASSGAAAFFHEVGGAFKDVIVKPARGFREEGPKGAVIGVVKAGHANYFNETGRKKRGSVFDKTIMAALGKENGLSDSYTSGADVDDLETHRSFGPKKDIRRLRLAADGHRVRVAAGAEFRDEITGRGLEFYPLAGAPKNFHDFIKYLHDTKKANAIQRHKAGRPVLGYVSLNDEREMEKMRKFKWSRSLNEFTLATRNPVIYFGVSTYSLANVQIEQLLRQIDLAAEQAKVQIIFQAREGRPGCALYHSENIYEVESNFPYSLILRKVAATVHWGEPAIVEEGLAAGKPVGVCVTLSSQYYAACMCVTARVGVPPINLQTCTVDSLAASFHQLLEPELKKRAEEIAKTFSPNESLEKAVETFYSNLPLRAMRCDVDENKIARIYDPRSELKLSFEAYLAIQPLRSHDDADDVSYKPLWYDGRHPAKFSLRDIEGEQDLLDIKPPCPIRVALSSFVSHESIESSVSTPEAPRLLLSRMQSRVAIVVEKPTFWASQKEETFVRKAIMTAYENVMRQRYEQKLVTTKHRNKHGCILAKAAHR
ncbi:hypothetical protein G195_008338 [Phytophthora kernoviae 00238/432]|uniref:PH domain-containing protein n=1 Tax=Phytophthora kernoviae 00238/432 TaxID=1284355 RepID=A0A8J4W3B8_9STRA|nr:hypothetical protein G195_008338 [Phytophthora kernoviae 00238/432]